MLRISRKENGACEKYFRWVRRAHEHMSRMCLITLSSVNKGDSLFLHRPEVLFTLASVNPLKFNTATLTLYSKSPQH